MDGPLSGRNDTNMTPAMLALSNKQYEVVEWLENKRGAKKHRELFTKQHAFEKMDHLFARSYLIRPLDETYKETEVSCILLALSNRKYHIVEWMMEEEKCELPDGFDSMDHDKAREVIGSEYFE